MKSSKLITLSITALLMIGSKAYADLSPNPWLIPNDKDAIKEIYNKNQKRQNTARTEYREEAAPEIDLSRNIKESQDIQQEEKGIGSKLKGVFSKDKQESLPKPPKSLPKQNIKPATASSPTLLDEDAFGFDGVMSSIKRGINNVWKKTVYYYNRAKRSLQISIRKLWYSF